MLAQFVIDTANQGSLTVAKYPIAALSEGGSPSGSMHQFADGLQAVLTTLDAVDSSSATVTTKAENKIAGNASSPSDLESELVGPPRETSKQLKFLLTGVRNEDAPSKLLSPLPSKGGDLLVHTNNSRSSRNSSKVVAQLPQKWAKVSPAECFPGATIGVPSHFDLPSAAQTIPPSQPVTLETAQEDPSHAGPPKSLASSISGRGNERLITVSGLSNMAPAQPELTSVPITHLPQPETNASKSELTLGALQNTDPLFSQAEAPQQRPLSSSEVENAAHSSTRPADVSLPAETIAPSSIDRTPDVIAGKAVRPVEGSTSANRVPKSSLRESGNSSISTNASLHAPTPEEATAIFPIRDNNLLDRRLESPFSLSPASSSPASERETFSALDSASLPPHTTWIHTGAHHAEAGYLDPGLGWVSVRVDGTASGVHAALVPGSREAASILGTHLDGLNALLSDHQDHAAIVTVADPATESSYSSTAQQQGSMNGQPRQQQRQDSAPEPNHDTPNSRASNPLPSWDRNNSLSASAFNQPLSNRLSPSGRGVHVSVIV